jgi:4-hydroxy-tetrahydrodipicolinate synthase
LSADGEKYVANYSKKEARDWAWANMRGVANVVNPTFTEDLSALNEKAIRYDVRKEIEYGFWGALLVAETATTPEEYIRFTQWAGDEAHGKLHLIFHASFNTLAQNVSVARAAHEASAELVLRPTSTRAPARTFMTIPRLSATRSTRE